MIGSPTRVLVLTSLFPSRPGEKQGNFVLDQVRELASQGAEVTVLVARPWTPPFLGRYAVEKAAIDTQIYQRESFAVTNASFFSLPRFALGRYAARFVRMLSTAIEHLNSEQPFDLIHTHGLQLGHAAVEAAARLRIPSVLTVHGIETAARFDNSRAKREQIADVLDRTSCVVLVGSPLIDYVRKYTRKVDHCIVVGNGFASYPGIQASKLIPRSRPVRVVAVSNYEESKGFELLVSAVDSLEPELRAQIEVVLVGGGRGFDIVHQQVDRLGLTDSVHYTGPLKHQDVMAEVMASDIFCLPSWREAFGIMYAEAMSLGKFTIGCQGQGPSDFIRHLETGYLVEPRSSTSVAEALRWVLQNLRMVRSIAERGRTYAVSNLTWSQNAAKMIHLYRSLIANKSWSDGMRSSAVNATLKV